MTDHLNRIDLIRPDAPDLARRGPCPVGVRTLDIVNPAAARCAVAAAPPQGPAPGGRALVSGGRGDRAGRALSRPVARRADRVALHGMRRGMPRRLAGDHPLVILSHGYPGNRMLMAHLAEELASQGYRVAAIDHADSTYGDAAYLSGRGLWLDPGQPAAGHALCDGGAGGRGGGRSSAIRWAAMARWCRAGRGWHRRR